MSEKLPVGFTLIEEIQVHDPSELVALSKRWSSFFLKNSLILLMGPLGSGKSTWVRSLLGTGTSPTFALHHHYEIQKPIHTQVEHWDLYRIENDSDLESSGFWDQFFLDQILQRRWVLVEWPEKLDWLQLPNNWNQFAIEIILQGTSRTFRLSGKNLLEK